MGIFVKWTCESVREEARKYSSRTEFYNGSPRAYIVALKKCPEVLDEVFGKVADWSSRDVILAEARKYSSRTDFQKGSKRAYRVARTKYSDILDEVFGECIRQNDWRSKDAILVEARKYNSRAEFMKRSTSAYQAAIKKYPEVLDKLFGKVAETKDWSSREAVLAEARKYSSRGEFWAGSPRAYYVARTKFSKILNDIFGKNESKAHGYWTEEMIRTEAKKYSSKTELKKKNGGAYTAARKIPGLLDDIFGKSEKKENGYWTKETLREEAMKYSSRWEFGKNNGSAYQAARKNFPDLLDEVFGKNTTFYKSTVLALLADKWEDLEHFDAVELLSIVEMGILPKRFLKVISSPKRKTALDAIKAELEGSDEEIYDDEMIDDDIDPDDIDSEDLDADTTVANNIVDIPTEEAVESKKVDMMTELKAVDHFLSNVPDSVLDGQTSRALVRSKVSAMWNLILDGADVVAMVNELKKSAGKWLKLVINDFEKMYAEVTSLEVPSDYGFEFKPNMMQNLIAYSMMNNNHFGNWSGPGAGKTNSFLLAASMTNRKCVVVICPNSVVSTIERSIDSFYNDSIKIDTVAVAEMDTLRNYSNNAERLFVVINYEKFQQPAGVDGLIADIVKLNPDMLIFDEIHRAKEDATEKGLKKSLVCLRKDLAKNKGLKVMGMTATPLVNHCTDVRFIMELLTGKKYDEITKCDKNPRNCVRAHQALLLNGFRYIPKYPMKVNDDRDQIIKITKSIPYDKTIATMLRTRNWCGLDRELAKIKFDMMCDQGLVNPGHTIVYTNYVTGIIDTLKGAAEDNSLSYYTWTGEEKEAWYSKKNFDSKSLDRDVLIGSKPISTGVDGLQKVCDTIVVIGMPYTYADYEQLVGRIYRQGSNFQKAKIYRLNVTMLSRNGKTIIDLDQRRFEIVENKKNLYKAVVDGEIKKIFKYDEDEVKKIAKNTIKKIKDGEALDVEYNRADI